MGHRGGTVVQCSPLRDTQAIEVTESEGQLNKVQYLNNTSSIFEQYRFNILTVQVVLQNSSNGLSISFPTT